MTKEEENIFMDKVKETILPIAIYLKEDEIRKIIKNVEESNNELPEGFGKMLLEKILVLKYNRLSVK